ncbi:AAA family ATPase [Erysipelotrichia bacterium]
MSINFGFQLANFLRARFPILYIPTWEEERVILTISSVVADETLIKTVRKVFVWASTTGIVAEGMTPRDETKAPLKALEFIETFDEPAVFILKDLHVFFGAAGGRQPDHQLIRKVRDIVPGLKQSAKPKGVIFIAPLLVLPNDLQKDVTVVDFPLPTFGEIKHVLDEMIAANKQGGRITIDLTEKDAERLVKAAMGLTLQESENAFARSMVNDGRLDINDLEVILEEKAQIIKKTGILEFIKSDEKINDVGGLGNLKRWLSKRSNAWLDEAKKYGLPAPKGVLITGVPGCGKSLIAKAVSSMWQLPLLRLDVGRIFSGIVGSSEENLRNAIKTAEATAPSVLWVDELEKGFGGLGSSGDSGTSTRVFATFLTWMQEKEKPVFVIATANNINALPPELMRKGRFDEIFFVDLPTKRERMFIFAVHLKKRIKDSYVKGNIEFNSAFIEKLADATEGFVGAEIEQVVIASLFEAFSENRGLLPDDFEKSIRNTVPLSVTQQEQIRAIRDWANVRAVAATGNEDRVGYEANTSLASDDLLNSRGGRVVDF